jgi:hypothetical protein
MDKLSMGWLSIVRSCERIAQNTRKNGPGKRIAEIDAALVSHQVDERVRNDETTSLTNS